MTPMIAPMLLKIRETLPSGGDYLFEIKLDGQRTLAEIREKRLTLLYTRNFQKVTAQYPELHKIGSCIRARNAVLDGEIVSLQNGIPSFEQMQLRMSLRDLRKLP